MATYIDALNGDHTDGSEQFGEQVMAKTYRITIEYTTTNDTGFGSNPEYWDWPELLDLNPSRETFGLVSVSRLPEVNQDHLSVINQFAAEN